LGIKQAFVLTPGEKQYALDEKVTVMGLKLFLRDVLANESLTN